MSINQGTNNDNTEFDHELWSTALPNERSASNGGEFLELAKAMLFDAMGNKPYPTPIGQSNLTKQQKREIYEMCRNHEAALADDAERIAAGAMAEPYYDDFGYDMYWPVVVASLVLIALVMLLPVLYFS